MTEIKPIGFTTGSLYRSKMSLAEIAEFYYSCGANAIELSWATPAEFLSAEISERLIEAAKKFEYISIHAPWKEVSYDSGSETEKIVAKLKIFCSSLPIKGIVLHPHIIADFDILKRSNLPFLLENTDKRKKFGIAAGDFEKLKSKCDFGFVLDLQHAYEHDPTMKLAAELIKVMGDRLNHFHVSGESEGEIHVPVHLARNKDAIAAILKKLPAAPIILEGILLNDFKKTIEEELNFVKSNLSAA